MGCRRYCWLCFRKNGPLAFNLPLQGRADGVRTVTPIDSEWQTGIQPREWWDPCKTTAAGTSLSNLFDPTHRVNVGTHKFESRYLGKPMGDTVEGAQPRQPLAKYSLPTPQVGELTFDVWGVGSVLPLWARININHAPVTLCVSSKAL